MAALEDGCMLELLRESVLGFLCSEPCSGSRVGVEYSNDELNSPGSDMAEVRWLSAG
jgi:hypothetical protein